VSGLRIFALAAAVAGVPASPSALADSPVRSPGTVPGHLRISVGIEPNSLIPAFFTGHLFTYFGSLIFDPLTTVDDRGNIVPRLALQVPTRSNGGISRDGRTIRFRLRRDVRWQDGVPFTSRDVAFTQSLLDDDRNGIPGRRIVARVETPDPYTVVFHLKYRTATALLALFNGASQTGFVLPEHALAKVRDLHTSEFNAMPIGTGPFQVTSWHRGVAIELVANERYYLHAPRLRRITIDLWSNGESQVAALRRHDVDWEVSATAPVLRELARTAGVRVVFARQYAWYAIAFNLATPALRDVRVRRAIALAIDRPKIAKSVFLGIATAATGDVPDFSWAYPAGLADYPYDPGGATRLLAQAGFSRGRLHLLLTSVPILEALDVTVQDMLRRAGIEADIRIWPLPLYYAPKSMGGIINNGRFDLGVIGSFSPPDPDEDAAFSCASRPPAGPNVAGYCNPAFDRLVAASLATDDRVARKRIYRRIEETLHRELPYLFLAWPLAAAAISSDLRGVRPGPGTLTWNAADWTI